MTEQPDDLRQAVGLTCRRACEPRKTFSEDLAIAPLVPTAPATRSHPNCNGYPLSGKIAKRPRVEAMPRTRWHATERTISTLATMHRDEPTRLFPLDGR